MGAFMSTPVFVDKKDRTVVFGNQAVEFHKEMTGEYVKVVNNKCYIDGYRLKEGKWKRTPMALWHLSVSKRKKVNGE